ncbi:TIGR04282 family arsenosugar biosynthesis glycosyltransferase [uncultured Tissierella sp.]|jgi:rSAM/selenodomain-associated transferase 1|uniref:TIGR04282 family arsenosugar biosynthesis glycosyltransferase n=1 Tax=uncultured Tissierella sp. TaxID=448160 RepID=UPI002803DCC5|nr:TIGR04282 family arsenosugar biosynthesis glycosyltransferase [uncultured Tissierella sp.]MDU5080484.1 TIGR04282 family arsenosugar biosynthesis glycosyltransferase [Bacillota bacterium]
MNALILMTRIPMAGQTKTRLMDIMSGDECAELHMAFLKDLFNTFKKLKEIDIYLTYTPENSLDTIENIIPEFVKTLPQIGEDLGNKMYNAINDILSLDYEKVILIGSDIPHIKNEDILHSFKILEEKDIVLGPSYDGGYYLIGMKKPNEGIFHISKKWGGKSVLESTIDMANNQRLTVGLAAKYMDIDTKEDLFAFMDKYEGHRDKIALKTVKFIKEWRENTGQGQIDRTNKRIY